jgi:uncharacterized membrane protein
LKTPLKCHPKVKPTQWFGIIVLYTVLTLVCVYFIPNDSFASFIKVVFGFTFVALLPGYCLVSFLFEDGKLDIVEQGVLSVALSFAIAGISGLFLGLSAIGITAASVTNTLCIIVLLLGTLAFLRKINVVNIEKINWRKPKAQTTIAST